jgi:hypothetical protein
MFLSFIQDYQGTCRFDYLNQDLNHIKMKPFIIFIALVAGFLSVDAQNEVDALRYSRLSVVGTARYSGLGGAFGALGADFSSLSVNPAGIALYRTSDFSITPSLYMADAKSVYYGEQNTNSRSNFSLGNVGFVSVTNTGAGQNSFLRKVMFGFGLNRTNDFNNHILIKGFNDRSSLLTVYRDQANGNTPSQLSGQDFLNKYGYSPSLAYDTYLIDETSVGSHEYFNDMPDGGVTQEMKLKTSGSMNEMVLSMGVNLKDKFFLGATVGIPYMRYFEKSTYSEIDSDSTNFYFNSFTQTNTLSTTGSGINLKIGMIYKPVDFIRIGAAFHTPTYYGKMTDKYTSTMVSVFDTIIADNRNSFSSSSPNGEYEYSLTTPLRAIGSIAFIFGKYGLLSADYEYVNYKGARLNAESYDFSDENYAIRHKYKGSSNLRLGTEWKYGQFSIRGGYGIEGDPYKSGVNNCKSNSYSLGLGYREKTFYLDLGYLHTSRSEDYYLYDASYSDPSRITLMSSSIMLTYGVRF